MSLEPNSVEPTPENPLNIAETPEVIPAEALPEGHKSGYVAVVGRPNVGKSTLLNSLLRQKIAIVSPRAQTTRLAQLGIVTEEDHQIVFVDTPGIMKKALHKLDEVMLATATDSLQDADVVLWLVDANYPPEDQEENLAAMVSGVKGQLLLVMNKNDLVQPDDVLDRVASYRALLPEETPWFFVSAEHGHGLDEIYEAILTALPLGPRYYPADQITLTFVRDLAAELIREQVLRQLRDEVPHGSTVSITMFKEEEDPLHIGATIFVDRESHKPIVIGSGGQQLRQIGTAARIEIENLLERPVYLDLWVKVAPKWRREENLLKRFGYMKS